MYKKDGLWKENDRESNTCGRSMLNIFYSLSDPWLFHYIIKIKIGKDWQSLQLCLCRDAGSESCWCLPWSRQGLFLVIIAGAQPCLFQGASLHSTCPTIATSGTIVMSERSITYGFTPPRWFSCPSNLTQTSHFIQLVPPPPSIFCVWVLPEPQSDAGCVCTRSTLDPSFWQCHWLQSNYSSHELDPVHPLKLKLPQLTAKVQTVTQWNHSHVSLTPDYALKITVSYDSMITFSYFIIYR